MVPDAYMTFAFVHWTTNAPPKLPERMQMWLKKKL
jgi:hypothetical protein